MKTHRPLFRAGMVVKFLGTVILLSPRAFGHCDTMDEPVVQAAKVALEKKDVTPVLMWIKPDREAEERPGAHHGEGHEVPAKESHQEPTAQHKH